MEKIELKGVVGFDNDEIVDTDDDILDTDSVIKSYKVKPYLNNDKGAFGLTINGNGKEYIDAHLAIKKLIKKGKLITASTGKFKVVDVKTNKTMIQAVIEVTALDAKKGNVDLKIYDPSVNKKKGATIEIRKAPDFEYFHVENLQDIIISLLDSNIAGQVIHKDIGTKPKVFSCDICKWETKFGSCLKAHKSRMHINARKRAKNSLQCKNLKCDKTFEDGGQLNVHMQNEHVNVNLKKSGTESPFSSPPRKKFELELEDSEEEMLDLDNMEIAIEKELSKNLLQEKKIKELETVIDTLLKDKGNDNMIRSLLEKDLFRTLLRMK